MNLLVRIGAFCGIALLAACSSEPDEPPFNEQFNSLSSELETKANALDREAENFVQAEANELEAQTQALQNSTENAAGNTVGAAEDAEDPR